MISDVQLSRHLVERRISDIDTAIESQLHFILPACGYFSAALDRSCDIQYTPQLAMFAQCVLKDCLIKEKLFHIVPLKDKTRVVDVKEAMTAAFAKPNLSITKLTATATDVALAMIGSANGLVGLCKADQAFSE